MKRYSIIPPLLAMLLVALMLAFPDSPAHATEREKLNFSHITTAEGLSNDGVWTVAQDKSGFMWFGTTSGLDRYDGTSFRSFNHDPNTPNSLSDDAIRSLLVDHTGTLWVGTWSGGLNRYDSDREHFIRYQNREGDPASLSGNAIRALYQDKAGTLWVGTTNGLNRMERNGNFQRFTNDPDDATSLSGNNVFAILEDSFGTLWVGTDSGLNALDRETGAFTRYQHDTDDKTSLSSNAVRAILEDKTGIIWIGTYEGLNRFDRVTESFVRYFHDPHDSRSLLSDLALMLHEDSTGTLWVGSYGSGLNRYDRETDTFLGTRSAENDAHGLSSNNIFSAIDDDQGMTWFVTDGGGINILDHEGKRFHAYRFIQENPNSLSQNSVRAIFEDSSGLLWFGTDTAGLNSFDRETGEFTRYMHVENDPDTIAGNSVWAIGEDNVGNLWTGGQGMGLSRLDKATGKFSHFRHKPNSVTGLSSNTIMDILGDRAGDIWVGTWGNGLDRLNPATGEFTNYRHDVSDPESLDNNQVLSVYEGRDGQLWIGTMGGLNRFDPASEAFTKINRDTEGAKSFGANGVLTCYEDWQGTIWAGTFGGGLIKYVPETGTLAHFTMNDGLPSNTIFGILGVEKDKELWLSTASGLARLDMETKSFRNFTVEDGLENRTYFPTNSYCRTRDGMLLFGGTKGVDYFYPFQVRDNPHPPPIVITDFKLANKSVPIGEDSVLKKSIIRTQKLRLSYLDRIFSFEFTALNYRSPMKNRFRYTMEGFDTDWFETDNSRPFATYTNLDPGTYVFRVIGSNNDGIWNEGGTSIAITITPPWWQTLTFRLISFVLFVGMGLVAYRRRIRNIQARNEELSREVAERTHDLQLEIKEREQVEERIIERTRELDKTNRLLQSEIHIRKQTEKAIIKAKDEAEQATRAKSEFLANMSHEIRTPMNAIIGMTHLAKATQLSPSQRDYLGKIDLSARSLLGIINDILDLSKIEAGMLTIEDASFKLDQVLEQLTTIISPKANEKRLEFLIKTGHDIPTMLRGDSLRLSQVLINLCNNAVKFTDSGSIVFSIERLKTDGDTALLRFSVKDDGIGIERDKIDSLFQPFTQADASTTRQYGGTGLGLSLCTQLTEAMGGTIGAESEPGKGSLFWVEIPFVVQEDKCEDCRVPSELRGLKVLIVDDNSTSRIIIKGMLEQQGLNADLSKSGYEALEILRNTPADQAYDLVILDWRMPGMDGLETADIIINDKDISPTPPIFMVSAYGNETLVKRTHELGLKGLLFKPISQSLLFNLIVETFGREFATNGVGVDDFASEGMHLQGAKILLVEDNEINRQVAREMLVAAGLIVTEAVNGLEAMDRLAEEDVDLVLMDVQMPELDGHEATRRLRLMDKHEKLPIVAMTAHAMAEDRQKSLDAGMNDHIAKPFNPDELFRTLSKWITRRPDAEMTVDVHRARAAAPSTIDTEDFPPTLPGIDIRMGLKRSRGNRKLYKSLLILMDEKYAGAADEITAALAEGRIEDGISIAHSVKGTSGMLGAEALYEAASALEKGLDQDGDKTGERLNKFRQELDVVIKGLEPLKELENNVTALKVEMQESSTEDLIAAIDELRPHLARGAALKCRAGADKLQSLGWPDLVRTEVTSVLKLIAEYNFKKANTLLDEIVDKLPK